METTVMSKLVHCKCSFCGYVDYVREENLIIEGNDVKTRCEVCGNLFYL